MPTFRTPRKVGQPQLLRCRPKPKVGQPPLAAIAAPVPVGQRQRLLIRRPSLSCPTGNAGTDGSATISNFHVQSYRSRDVQAGFPQPPCDI